LETRWDIKVNRIVSIRQTMKCISVITLSFGDIKCVPINFPAAGRILYNRVDWISLRRHGLVLNLNFQITTLQELEIVIPALIKQTLLNIHS
jgi:hypothetical protein